MTESNSLYDTRYNSPSQSANNQIIKPQLLMNTNCNPQQQPHEIGDNSQSIANPFMHAQLQPQASNQYHHHQPAQYPQNIQAPQQQQSLQPVVQQQNQSGSQSVVASPINISIPNRPPPTKPQQPLPPKSWTASGTSPGTPQNYTILGHNMNLVGGGGGEGRESHGSNERIKNMNPNNIVRIATHSPTRQTRLSHQFTPNLGPQTTTATAAAVAMINHHPSSGHHVVRYSGSGMDIVNNGSGGGQTTTTNGGLTLPAVSTVHSTHIQTIPHSPQAPYLQSNMRYHSSSMTQ